MKSVNKALREGYYAALSGVISVPVYDGAAPNHSDTAFVVIANVQSRASNTMSSFRTDVTVDLDICHRQVNSYTRDTVDGIENEILQIMVPSVDTGGFTVSGFKVYNVAKQSGNYIDEPGDDENMVRCVLRISQTLLEQ